MLFDAGEVGTSKPLVLNATESRDLDGLSSVPFQFLWACVDVASNSPCVQATNGAVLSLASMYASDAGAAGQGSVVHIPAGLLRTGTYTFTVEVSKGIAGGLVPRTLRSSK